MSQQEEDGVDGGHQRSGDEREKKGPKEQTGTFMPWLGFTETHTTVSKAGMLRINYHLGDGLKDVEKDMMFWCDKKKWNLWNNRWEKHGLCKNSFTTPDQNPFWAVKSNPGPDYYIKMSKFHLWNRLVDKYLFYN